MTVVLVTGASSGIGLATARRVCDCGRTIVLVDADKASLGSICNELQRTHDQVCAIQADVSSDDDMDRVASIVRDRFGGLDAVVASAGINGVWAPIDELTASEWDRTVRVNLRGTYLTLNRTVPLLKARGGGSIVIVSSINGVRSFTSPGATAYSATKAAQVAITQQLALELARHSIRINVVCPGAIDTNIADSTEIRSKEKTEVPVIWPEGSVPLTHGKSGQASDVAETIAFLLSDGAKHITGTPVFVDGGQGLLR